MVPTTMLGAAVDAVTKQYLGTNVLNSLVSLADKQGFTVDVAANPLTTMTDSFVVFDTSTDMKPLVAKGDGPLGNDIRVLMLDENSEHCAKYRECQYIMEAEREVEYGQWRGAVKVTME